MTLSEIYIEISEQSVFWKHGDVYLLIREMSAVGKSAYKFLSFVENDWADLSSFDPHSIQVRVAFVVNFRSRITNSAMRVSCLEA